MLDTIEVQTLTEGTQITLGNKPFTIIKLGDTTKYEPHILSGARGAEYFLMPYLPARSEIIPSGRAYIVSVYGAGAPLRHKNGKRIEAYMIGDLITDATGK